MVKTLHAHRAGLRTPRKEERPGRVSSGGAVAQGQETERANSPPVPASLQAARTIECEGKAAQFLARLHAQQADPDELAFIVAEMYGSALRGFCRAIAKALQGMIHGR